MWLLKKKFLYMVWILKVVNHKQPLNCHLDCRNLFSYSRDVS